MVNTHPFGHDYAVLTASGADQGLLNQYFSSWNRLPFTYNMTVVGGSNIQNYQ